MGLLPVALSMSFLLAYIKHLAVSSRRRALKATVCSPKGEVTIQEPCFLKGFLQHPESPGRVWRAEKLC